MTDDIGFELLKELKILIIDDEEFDGVIITRKLKELNVKYNCVCTVLHHMRDAIHLLSSTHFDFIFVDLNLKDDYGASSIKSIHSHTTATIVAMTGFGSPLTEKECYKAGASYFLLKNKFTKQDLQDIISSN